jgi:hypothetical protein
MNRTSRYLCIPAAVLVAGFACCASASQTLYKLIDKNGKVTYSQEAPKDFDGKVIPLEVDTNRNTATLPKFEEAPAAAQQRRGAQADLEALREKVARRKAALEQAENNPGEDDIQWLGNAGGGVRRVPTPAYQKRIAELERALKEAQDELQAAESREKPADKNPRGNHGLPLPKNNY